MKFSVGDMVVFDSCFGELTGRVEEIKGKLYDIFNEKHGNFLKCESEVLDLISLKIDEIVNIPFPGGFKKTGIIEKKLSSNCYGVLIDKKKYAFNSSCIERFDHDFKIGDEVECYFNGEIVPAKVEKIEDGTVFAKIRKFISVVGEKHEFKKPDNAKNVPKVGDEVKLEISGVLMESLKNGFGLISVEGGFNYIVDLSKLTKLD